MGVTSGADEPTMPEYLTRRGPTYYFRRVIPEHLRAQFGNKRELTVSLRTKDRAEAIRRRNREAVRTDEAFAAAASASHQVGIGSLALGPRVSKLSHDERIARLIHTFRKERDEANTTGRLAAFNQMLRDQLTLCDMDLEHGTWNVEEPVDLDRSKIMQSAIRAVLQGDFSALDAPPVRALEPAKVGISLNAVLEQWAFEKKPKERSIDMWRRTSALFTSVTGKEKVGQITKADVLAFKAHLLAEGRAPATIDSRLNHLRSLFRFAVENDIIGADPASTVKAPPAKRAKDARIPFDDTALSAVFSSAIYTQGERPNRGAGEASYWLPLLALYTGARLNELGQLRPQDVAEESYRGADDTPQTALVVRIVEDERDGLTLKNASSNRRIPLHQTLIALGFVHFVEAAQRNNQTRLFPDLKPDRYGHATGNWSKWFGYHLREVCRVDDRRITFHSLRHTFKHHGRICGLDKAVNDALTGHESGDVSDTYGGLEYPLRPLVEGMSRFRVQGFTPPPPPT